MGLESEKVGTVGAKLDDFRDRGVRIVAVAIVAAIDERPPDFLAKRAVIGEGQDGIDCGTGIDDRIGTGGKFALLGGRSGGSLYVLRNAPHLGLGGCRVGALVCENFLREGGEFLRKLLIIGRQLLLLRGIEAGTVAHHPLVEAGDETLLLCIQARAFARVINRFHPLEESGIERDLVIGGGELWRPFAAQGLNLGGCHVAGHHAEEAEDPAKALPRLL